MHSEFYYSRMLEAIPQRSPKPILIDPKNIARPKRRKLYPFQQLTPAVNESLGRVVRKDRPLLDKNRYFTPLSDDREAPRDNIKTITHRVHTGPTLDRSLMFAAEMKSEFRRLTTKYGKQSELKRLCHWGPDMLTEVRRITKAFPSPHPLRIAVVIYIIEAMTDFHNFGTDLRRELFAGLYTNGQSIDDLLCHGVTSAIIDSVLCQESACFSRKAELVMEQQVESLEAHHNIKMRRKESDTRAITRSSLRQYFNHWNRLTTRSFILRTVRWREVLNRRLQLQKIISKWKELVWITRTRISDELYTRQYRTLTKKHEDEIQLLNHDHNDRIASLRSKAASLEEQVLLLKTQQSNNEEVELLNKQNNELSNRTKELTKESHTNRESAVIASLQVESLTDTLTSLFEIAKTGFDEVRDGQRPGVRATDFIEGKIGNTIINMNDYSLKESDSIHKTAEDCPTSDSVLRSFLNFVLGLIDSTPQKDDRKSKMRSKFHRRVSNFSRDLNDCEIFIVVTSYLWSDHYLDVIRILDIRALPERADHFVTFFKNLHPRCYMEWLTGSSILGMNTLVNMNIAVVMMERYRHTHILQGNELTSSGLSEYENGGVNADAVTDDLSELNVTRVRCEVNKRAMEELITTVRDGVFSLAMHRMSQPKTIAEEEWDPNLMSLWYSYSDERLSSTLPGLSRLECDSLRTVFHDHSQIVESVFSYYSNLTTAFQGICLSDFLRLCGDCQLPIMRSLSGKARVENMYFSSQQLQSSTKGIPVGEMLLLLIRLMEEKTDDNTTSVKLDGSTSQGLQTLGVSTSRERSVSLTNPTPGRRSIRPSVYSSSRLSPKSRVTSLIMDHITPRTSRTDIRGFKDLYWSLPVQSAIQVHSKMLGSIYDYFSRRDETNRGNNTSISLDEWLKLTKDLECRDAQLTRIDVTLIFNTSQDMSDGTAVTELSYREFLEAFFAMSLCRISNPLLPVPVRFHTFCSERLVPVLRRKFPQIKVTYSERNASTVS